MCIVQPTSNDKTSIIPIHHFPQKIIFLIALPDSQGSCTRRHRSDLIISKHNSIGGGINWKNFWRSGIVNSHILIWWISYIIIGCTFRSVNTPYLSWANEQFYLSIGCPKKKVQDKNFWGLATLGTFWPKVPRMSKNVNKCPKRPRVPKMARKCSELPNFKIFFHLKLFLGTPCI